MKPIKIIYAAILFIIVVQIPVSAQSIYYDAIELASKLDANGNLSLDDPRVLEILDKYNSPNIRNTKEELESAYHTTTPGVKDPNPYINFSGTAQSSSLRYNGKTFDLGEGLSKLGSLNVTTIADGAAQFLIERAKRELVIAYFEKFNEALNKPEFKTLFPTTNDYLSVFQAHQLSSMLAVLKDSFSEDLINLPANVINLEDLPEYNSLFASNDGKLVKTGLLLYDPIGQGDNVAELLQFLSDKNSTPLSQLDGSYSSIYSSIKLGNIISESLRSIQNDKLWVNQSQIIEMFNDNEQFHLYLGLLFQQTKDVTLHIDGKVIRISKLLEEAEDQIQKLEVLRSNLQEFVEILDQANKVWDDASSMLKSKQNIDFQLLQKHSLSLINLIEHSGNFTEAFIDTANLNQQLNQFTAKLTRAISLAENLRAKEYTASLLDVSVLLKSLSYNPEMLKELTKYGIFISSIAEADSPDKVQEILEANVLPPTSYRTKRLSKSSIDINSYVGVYGGWDIDTENYNGSPGFGPWVPIGPAFTIWTTEKGASNTIFFSFIDIGAFASFRLENTEEVLPEFDLQNIVSPGIFFVRGVNKSPLSWHLGVQYGPNVREIEQGVEAASYRIHAGISVDIPLFNLKAISKN